MSVTAFAGLFAAPVSPSSSMAGVVVSLPNTNSPPGVLIIPVTVGDLTGQNVLSCDFQITFDPSVVTPASPPFDSTGTLSDGMSITPNPGFSGHLIMSLFRATALSGSGTLINLRFNVIGMPGQGTPLVFEDYTDPGSTPHAGFKFNEGMPLAKPINGGVTVIAGPTATSTNTNTPTSTPTFTPTRTNTSTPTATSSPSSTPICANVSMPNLTALTNSVLSVPVNTSNVAGLGAVSASFTVTYDPGVVTPNGVTFGPVGSSNGGGRTLSFGNPSPGILNISIFGGGEFQGSGALVNLNFNVISIPGPVGQLNFTTFQYNAGPPCGTLTNGSVTVVAGTVSGRVTYGNITGPPSPRYVPNVLVSGSGSPPVSTLTNSLGAYSLNGFGSGAYTVSASKTGGVNGSISGFDAAKIIQRVVQQAPLTPAQLTVADVSGTGGISSFDATLVARYIVTLPETGSTGNWIFNPLSYTHQAIFSNISNENFVALLMGDVTGNWNHPNALPRSFPGDAQETEKITSVSLPYLVTPAEKEFVIPITVQDAAACGFISYEFDLRYDPAVLQPQVNPVDTAGTVSRGLIAVANTKSRGLLRVVVYGAMPIDSDGVLLNLKFTAVGTPGSVSFLTWERMIFNEGETQTLLSDGRIEISFTDVP